MMVVRQLGMFKVKKGKPEAMQRAQQKRAARKRQVLRATLKAAAEFAATQRDAVVKVFAGVLTSAVEGLDVVCEDVWSKGHEVELARRLIGPGLDVPTPQLREGALMQRSMQQADPQQQQQHEQQHEQQHQHQQCQEQEHDQAQPQLQGVSVAAQPAECSSHHQPSQPQQYPHSHKHQQHQGQHKGGKGRRKKGKGGRRGAAGALGWGSGYGGLWGSWMDVGSTLAVVAAVGTVAYVGLALYKRRASL